MSDKTADSRSEEEYEADLRAYYRSIGIPQTTATMVLAARKKSMLTTPSPDPQPVPHAQVASERDLFEAWYVEDMVRQMPGLSIVASEVCALRKGDGYGKDRVMLNGKWEGWQARAALAAQASGPDQAGGRT